ncbi:pancreatic lipase-related protein 2-like [Ixodes scapularis]
MKDELLKVGDFNVFAVDWSKASLYDYIQASANTRIVGLEVASLIEKLRLAFGVAPESMHVYGHSLGSHIGGYAGEKLQGRLGRITGLDPAEPFFQGMPTHVRLDEGDALYVDAVHTDGSRFAMSFEGIRETVACKHERAIQLMTASLELETNPDPDLCRLVGFACPSFEEFLRGSCSECGEDGSQCAVLGTATVPSGNPAKFYLKTADTAPYCREASACYGELGCLNMSGFYDSKRRNVNALPASRKTIGTRFLLYTRRNPTVPDTLLWNLDPDSLRDTFFDPERLTKFYIHGFMQVGKFPDYPIVVSRYIVFYQYRKACP